MHIVEHPDLSRPDPAEVPLWSIRSCRVHLREPIDNGKPHRGEFVRHVRACIAAGLSAALLAASVSSADARWGHGGFGHGGYHGRGGFYGGGPGLTYLMGTFVPRLRTRIGEDAVRMILVDSPARAFAMSKK